MTQVTASRSSRSYFRPGSQRKGESMLVKQAMSSKLYYCMPSDSAIGCQDQEDFRSGGSARGLQLYGSKTPRHYRSGSRIISVL